VADWALVQAADRGKTLDPATCDEERLRAGCPLFSKQLYVSSLSSYYIFYLIDKFAVSTQAAQLYLFIFLPPTRSGPSSVGRWRSLRPQM
jgi:hypothetical protein